MRLEAPDQYIQRLPTAMDLHGRAQCARPLPFFMLDVRNTDETSSTKRHSQQSGTLIAKEPSWHGLLCHIILTLLLWKGLMLLLFFLSVSLAADIAVSTTRTADRSYESAVRAVRLAELHLIRLVVVISNEIWSNVVAMTSSWLLIAQNLMLFTSTWEVKMSVLESLRSQSME